MRNVYWPCHLAAVLIIAFVDTHTDEAGIIVGSVLLLSGVLGIIFPARFIITWLVTGCVLFVTEALVGYGVLHAPWPSAPGISWAPLIALLPALLGAAIGVGLRRLAMNGAAV